ncbi:MAG: putative Ig domain-containing protein [Bradymonadales bacterium]|nr:putative Ig domain-containing protein [Bradymonadales bacterium]
MAAPYLVTCAGTPAPGSTSRIATFLAALLLMSLSVAVGSCGEDTVGSGDQDMTSPDGAGDMGDQEPADLLPVPCEEGTTMCWEGKLATCLPGGNAWMVERCRPDEVCVQGECVVVECEPGERTCEDNAIITCSADGSGWSEPQPCGEGETCTSGVCVPDSCTPGDRMCGTDRVFICQQDGSTWDEELCPEGWTCYQGECVECIRDIECDADQICEGGICQSLNLSILTGALPDGMVDQLYTVSLEATGGEVPYVWDMTGGDLPDGLSLANSGQISGTPTAGGEFEFSVRVTDAQSAIAGKTLSIEVHTPGLLVTTDQLPHAQEGMEYSARLEALGGSTPYAWMVASGVLPDGILLTSAGGLTGIPTEIGEFVATYRVFDSAMPPGWADKELTLTVDIAPIEIIGDQEYNLYLTKIIVLPMMTIISDIPIPYETQLQARGGLRPYHWTESEMTDMLRYLIPQAGIPEGLTLQEDGTLSGTVTSTDQVVSLTIPLTDITLNGFFFMAQVDDSQDTPDQASAVFHIPTFGF